MEWIYGKKEKKKKRRTKKNKESSLQMDFRKFNQKEMLRKTPGLWLWRQKYFIST